MEHMVFIVHLHLLATNMIKEVFYCIWSIWYLSCIYIYCIWSIWYLSYICVD